MIKLAENETIVLNFSKNDKIKIKCFLKKFEKIKTKTDFEETRVKTKNCTITLYNTGKVVLQGENCTKIKQELLSSLQLKDKLVFGIDETGRGERIGPFVIAGVLGKTNSFRELRDSKKTSQIQAKKDIVSKQAEAEALLSLNPSYIDQLRKKGITLNKIESKFIQSMSYFFDGLGEKTEIMVDGLPLNKELKGVEFLPKGDDLEPVISGASILAKHFRETSKNKKERKTWKKKN